MVASIADGRSSATVMADEEKAVTLPTIPKDEPIEEFPPPRKVVLIMLAVYLSMFLVALDRTIIGTAIPTITNEFHSITDVGWYASSYLLTSSAFQLIYGRIYTFYSPKWVLLIAIGIFEVGSTVCAAAPTSKAFIIGRAVAGLGSAGIFSGCIIIMVVSIPLHRRPMYQGIFGAIFGVASVAGPLIGGVFTTKLTWRWCFWINLPIGGVVMIILFFILKTPPSTNTDSIREQIKKLDPWGTAVFLPGIVCLLLALQWGGTEYAWGNARIIVLFVLAFVLLGLFVFIQFKAGDYATVPIRIIKQRSIAAGAYMSFVSPGAMMVIIYFLPIWFQAIKGVSAVQSGIDILPLVLSLVVSSIIAGILTQKTGYYVPQLIACSIIMAIGAGLLTMLEVGTGHGKWIGYQVVFGFGLGLGMQQAGMAAQASLGKKDVMTGVSLMFFIQGLGGSIFISIAQQIFDHTLLKNLGSVANLDPSVILQAGATQLRDLVVAADLEPILIAYNGALTNVFIIPVACAAASIVAGLTMEWRSIKGMKQGGAPVTPDGDAKSVSTAVSADEGTENSLKNADVREAPHLEASVKTGSA